MFEGSDSARVVLLLEDLHAAFQVSDPTASRLVSWTWEEHNFTLVKYTS